MNFWKRGTESHKRLKTFGPGFSELDSIHKPKKRTGRSRISCSKAQGVKKHLFYSGRRSWKVQCEVEEGRRTAGEAESAWR